MTIQSGLCGVYSFGRLHAWELLGLFTWFYFDLGRASIRRKGAR